MDKAAYVFTDIDFVLNSRRTLIAFGSYKPEALDPVAKELLETLVFALRKGGYEPHLIISSSWRIAHPDLDWWQSYVSPLVEGITPDLGGAKTRGQECEAYLEKVYDVYSPWVALDDRSIGEKHSDKWVQVDGDIGLSYADIDIAYHKLTNTPLLPDGFSHANKWHGMRMWNKKYGAA